MEILIKSTGEEVTENVFRSKYPNTSFPSVLTESILNSFDATEIHQGQQPQLTQHQRGEYAGLETIDGKVYRKWIAVDMTPEEIATKTIEESKIIRAKRDKLLSESDWTQVLDAPVNQSAWAQYRQALRDVPTQAGFPHNVTWPSKPE